jgi:hypothetical protein
MHISWLKKIAVTAAAAAAFVAIITFLSPAASASDNNTFLRSWATGRCLDSNFAGSVYTSPCGSGNSYQHWNLHYVAAPNVYVVENVATGMCLAANAPGALYTTYCHDPIFTNWTMYWYIGRPYPSVLVLQHQTTVQCLDSNHAGNAYTHVCGSNYQDWKDGF